MTLEQLLSPAVMDWYDDFKKKLNESNTTMTPEQIEEQFDEWLINNKDLVNESVKENSELINESIQVGIEAYESVKLNERLFDDAAFADDADDVLISKEDIEDEPVSGEVAGAEKIAHTAPATTLTGAIKLSSYSKGEPKRNVFVAVNALYDRLCKKGIQQEANSLFYRKLDVSEVKDMSALFAFADIVDADLSSWDTSDVIHMEGMFYKSSFNNDSICEWNVSSCADFKNMFSFSKFNQSLKKWTPRFIEVPERDSDGKVVTDPSTRKTIMKSVRAELPLVGAAADEESEILAQYWNEQFDNMEKEGIKENKFNHVIDFDDFVNEGKVKDFLHKGVEKVKKFFNRFALKLGDFVAFFAKDGLVCQAVSPYTSLNVVASGSIPGVSAYCAVENEYINDDVKKEGDIVESPEYYGIIDKDSLEYRNYQTFKKMVNEHYEKYGNTGNLHVVNEETFKRVGFKAEDGGLIDVPDIKSKDLLEILNDAIKDVPGEVGEDYGGSILIWGAPGIGKSTIPKSVIRAWNENSKKSSSMKRKALMVVECGDLTVDGFTLPIPVDKSVAQYLDERPLLNKLIADSGIDPELINSVKKNLKTVSTEAPKTWLPCFRITSNQEEVEILNAIANGHIDRSYKDGKIQVTETTDGGILLLDEFFRADENIFKILMQLIYNRTYNDEFLLGDKWAIICCSNRPQDDEEVERGFGSTGAVVGTRFGGGQYNFIPDFNEWKEWAVTKGKFDNITLEFLMFEEEDGEYTNWHTIRPMEYQKGKTGWPTPRTWSLLMNALYLYKKNHGYSETYEIPEHIIRQKASAIIGAEMANKYISFLKDHATSKFKVKELFENPKYEIPSESDITCDEVCNRAKDYLKVNYSPTKLPDVELLMNLFNNLNNTYSSSKDNKVKYMHVEIIRFFEVMTNKTNRIALKAYLQAVARRYSIEAEDVVEK